LFASPEFPGKWVAWTPARGWVIFPAARDGWDRAQPAPAFDPLKLNSIHIRQAFNTGFPGAPYESIPASKAA
jgi:hypothetical protein